MQLPAKEQKQQSLRLASQVHGGHTGLRIGKSSLTGAWYNQEGGDGLHAWTGGSQGANVGKEGGKGTDLHCPLGRCAERLSSVRASNPLPVYLE